MKRKAPASPEKTPTSAPDTPVKDVSMSTAAQLPSTGAQATNIDVKTAASADDEGYECCICLDSISIPIKLTCCRNHFCFLCLKGVKETAHRLRCPLCRADVDPKALEAKMETNEYENRMRAKKQSDWQWKYSGRQSGWWLYDDKTNEAIEQHYNSWRRLCHDFDQKMADAQNAPTAASATMMTVSSVANSSNVSNAAAPQNVQIQVQADAANAVAAANSNNNDPIVVDDDGHNDESEHSGSDDDDPAGSDGRDPSNPHSMTFPVVVAGKSYDIDFQEMVQINSDDRRKRRKIQREMREDIVKEFEKGKGKGRHGVKGVAGAQFIRSKSLETTG